MKIAANGNNAVILPQYMLSVLIPIYNKDVSKLVLEIHSQLNQSRAAFEIILLDDSSAPEYFQMNQSLSGLDSVKIIVNETNIGISKSRKKLCECSKFEWLLFIDADVAIDNENFISSYLKFITTEYDAIFGGYKYDYPLPHFQYKLRYKYGKLKEQRAASFRNTKPYKHIISGNFLVRKTRYANLINEVLKFGYGTDILIGILMRKENLSIYHIDNEVNHLGLDTNKSYLKKKEQAAKALVDFSNQYFLDNKDNDLLRSFNMIKAYKLNVIVSKIFKLSRKAMLKQLTSREPLIWVLQCYRLGFTCSYDLQISEG